MQFHRLNTLAAFVLGALAAQGAIAQNVVFSNTTDPDATPAAPFKIPLQAGVPVTVAPNGDIRANCQLDGTTQRCLGMPTGSGGVDPPPVDPTKPTVTMSSSLADSNTATPAIDVPANTTFTINVAPTNAMSCIRSASPSISSWSGSVLPAQAAATLSLPASSTYTFDIKCFNDAGSTSAPTLTFVTAEGTVDPPVTGEPAACANVRSHNYTRLTSKQLVTGTSAGNPLRNVTTLREFYGGSIGTTKYYISMGAGQYLGMAFTGAQLKEDLPGRSSYAPGGEAQSGYPTSGFTVMSISKCAGDFRGPQSVGDGLLLCYGDSRTQLSDIIYFNPGNTEVPGGMLKNVCTVDNDTTYYLNVLYADNTDGLTPNPPGEVSCQSSTTCGIRFNIE